MKWKRILRGPEGCFLNEGWCFGCRCSGPGMMQRKLDDWLPTSDGLSVVLRSLDSSASRATAGALTSSCAAADTLTSFLGPIFTSFWLLLDCGTRDTFKESTAGSLCLFDSLAPISP